jgi:hypothetical protein
VTAKRAQIHSNAAENAKGVVETIAGVPFGKQRNHMHVAFIPQRRLQGIAAALNLRPVFLGKVQIFELGIELNERGPDLAIEAF